MCDAMLTIAYAQDGAAEPSASALAPGPDAQAAVPIANGVGGAAEAPGERKAKKSKKADKRKRDSPERATGDAAAAGGGTDGKAAEGEAVKSEKKKRKKATKEPA